MKVILASSSPRRKELLEQIGLDFDIIKPDVEEISYETQPQKYVQELAHLKGEFVYKQVDDSSKLIIACDTIVWFQGRILEKPKSRQEAIKTLYEMSAQVHEVYTAVSCFYNNEQLHFVDKTQVEFYKLSEEFINDYVASGEPLDKAGSYGIQGKGQVMVKAIKGTFPSVMGFPTARFYYELKNWLKEESPL